jgi:hypothetical protein
MSNYHNNMSIIHFYQVPLLIAQGVIQTFQPKPRYWHQVPAPAPHP